MDNQVGGGTTFHVFLPRYRSVEGAAEAEDAPGVALAAQTGSSGQEREAPRDLTGKGTILLVED